MHSNSDKSDIDVKVMFDFFPYLCRYLTDKFVNRATGSTGTKRLFYSKNYLKKVVDKFFDAAVRLHRKILANI